MLVAEHGVHPIAATSKMTLIREKLFHNHLISYNSIRCYTWMPRTLGTSRDAKPVAQTFHVCWAGSGSGVHGDLINMGASRWIGAILPPLSLPMTGQLYQHERPNLRHQLPYLGSVSHATPSECTIHRNMRHISAFRSFDLMIG